MKTKAELIQERKDLLAKAKKILATADLAGRDITIAEKDQADALVVEIKALDVEIHKLTSDEAMREQILDLQKDMPGGVNRGAGGSRRGGVWSKDFMAGLPYQPKSNQKDILPPSGSVTVSPLSDTIGKIADDGRVESILQLIPIDPWSDDSFSYLRETKRQHAAKTVAVGEIKPESQYTLERIDDKIRTIAHLSEPISRTWISDAPMLQTYLDGALRDGLRLEMERQIVAGSGTGEDFGGILNTALVWIQAFDTNPLITSRKAITLLESLPVMATAWAMNPADWENIELSRDLTGQFVLDFPGVPVDRARQRLWGLPVALCLSLPQGTGLLANWASALRLKEREQAVLTWSEAFVIPADGYDPATSGFQRNLVQFRAECREGLEIDRPSAIVQVELELVGS